MEKYPEYLDLVGIAEIAAMAGVTKQSVSMWRKRFLNFPQPVADLQAGPVFWRKPVQDWLLKREQNPNYQRYLKQQKHPFKKQPPITEVQSLEDVMQNWTPGST